MSTPSSLILSIDTAQASCGVGLYRDSDVAFAKVEPMKRGQSERLLPMIQDALKEIGVSFNDVGAIAVNIGPGAFTGLRIGLSTAKSMGLALDIPVIGVRAFDGFAKTYITRKSEYDRFAVLLETKRRDFYVQVFAQDGGALTEPQALEIPEISALLQEQDCAVLVGDAVSRFDNEADDHGCFLVSIAVVDPLVLAQSSAVGVRSEVRPLYIREANISESKKKIRILQDL